MALDYIMHIPNIQGDVTLESHPNDLQILSFAWGINLGGNASFGGGGGAGKLIQSPITISRKVAKGSTKIASLCAQGKHIHDLTIFGVSGGENSIDREEYAFADCFITHYGINGVDGNDAATESLIVAWAKLEYTIRYQADNGQITSETVIISPSH